MYPFPLILLQIFLFQQLHSLIYLVPTKHEKEKNSYFTMYNCASLGIYYCTYFLQKKERQKCQRFNINFLILISYSIYEI